MPKHIFCPDCNDHPHREGEVPLCQSVPAKITPLDICPLCKIHPREDGKGMCVECSRIAFQEERERLLRGLQGNVNEEAA